MDIVEQSTPSDTSTGPESIAQIAELTKSLLCLRGTPVNHRKTGSTYYGLCDVIDCTNVRDGQLMRLYMNTDKTLFVRDVQEFHEKFEPKVGG